MSALSPEFLVVLVMTGALQTAQSTFAGWLESDPRGVTFSGLGAATLAGYGGGASIVRCVWRIRIWDLMVVVDAWCFLTRVLDRVGRL